MITKVRSKPEESGKLERKMSGRRNNFKRILIKGQKKYIDWIDPR
jgi:hypothetical protein